MMARLMILFILGGNLLLAEMCLANTGYVSKGDAGWMVDTVPYSINPPEQNGPVKIKISLDLLDINSISDHEESIGFTGALKLTWIDPRSAFDPNVAGVDEKTYSGDFQFNELSTSWYPQVVLLNENSLYETGASILKVRPDGSSTLIQTINAAAKTRMDLRLFPFDIQKLLIKFSIFGYNKEEMVLESDFVRVDLTSTELSLSEWKTIDFQYFVGETSAPILGINKATSTFNVEVVVKRKPVFVVRTIIIPLLLIVFLSFCVFWLDIKAIQDRLNVSFIGLLTITAYQLVISDILPHVGYFTLVHGLVSVSLIMVSLTITINILMIQSAAKLPNLINLNYACRWIFPTLYTFSLLALYAYK